MCATAVLILGTLILDTAPNHLARAQQELESGQFEQAAAELTAHLKVNPSSAEAHAMLAFAEWKLGRPAEAMRHYRTSIQLNPRMFSAHYDLALLYLERNDFSSALPELERAVQLDPQNASAQYNCALLLLQVGRASEAIPHLLRVRQLQPDRADARFQLFRALLAAGRVTEAHREAAAFVATNPEGAAPVGQAYLEAKEVDAAIKYLQKAFNDQPGNDDIRSLLAEAYVEARRPTEALSMLPQPTTSFEHYVKSEALLGSGDLPKALDESKQACELEPANARYLLLEGQLLQRMNSREANNVIDRAISADPNWFEPYYSRAVSSYLQQDYDAAEQNLANAIRLNPRCARCLFLSGVVYFNRGGLVQARKAFDRAIALDPKNARFRTHLAALSIRQERVLEAETELRKAISLENGYAVAHYQLGKLLARTPRLNEAAHELEEATRMDPGLTQALYQLAQVYQKLGRRTEAEQILAEFKRQNTEQKDAQVLGNDLAAALRR